MSNQIEVFLYSYRNKNLPDVVSNIYKTLDTASISVTVLDQNNIKRDLQFTDYPNLYYKYLTWDSIQSPCEFKRKFIEGATAEFVLILSDDTVLTPGWDARLVNFCLEKDCIISGHTIANLFQKDLFSIGNDPIWDNKFALSQYIDRNLIFGRTKLLQTVMYPGELKYNGEQEVYSINLLAAGIDIYAAPSEIYLDLEERTIENLYVPFSKDHNYGRLWGYLNNEVSNRFVDYHKIDISKIKPLPDYNNDVEYLYTDLDFAAMNGKKFIDIPNRIE